MEESRRPSSGGREITKSDPKERGTTEGEPEREGGREEWQWHTKAEMPNGSWKEGGKEGGKEGRKDGGKLASWPAQPQRFGWN